jgi:hypothetical protein
MILDTIAGIGSPASIGQTELFILPNGEAVDTTLRNSHEELFVAGRGDVG